MERWGEKYNKTWTSRSLHPLENKTGENAFASMTNHNYKNIKRGVGGKVRRFGVLEGGRQILKQSQDD